MSALEERLSIAAAAAREHSLAEQRVQQLQQRIDGLSRMAENQRAKHLAEQEDVDRLESVSLSRLVATVRGSRENALERERAEADAARLRLAHTEAQLAALRRDHAKEQSRSDELAEAPQRYAHVLDEKMAFLREIGDTRADRLFELAEEEGRLKGEIRELGEAVDAAQEADAALREAAVSLDRASSWSTYDTFLGGGVMASSMKHSRLDDAAEAASRADQRLAVLRTELADIPDASLSAPALDVAGGTRFMDIWLDNIFTDLEVADRIQQGQQDVARAASTVAEVMAGLAERARKTRNRLDSIDAERRRILTESTPPSS